MSGKRIFAVLLLIVLLTSFTTNPTKEEIQEALNDRIAVIFKKELGIKHDDAYELAMILYGNKIIEEVAGNYIEIENYYFFSLAQVSWRGDKGIIGGGAFRQIWFSKQIDQKAGDIISTLKKIR